MINEITFTHALLIALSALPATRVWRQNVGSVPIRNAQGKPIGRFDAGPPVGAADISGITTQGRRLEVELKMPGGRVRDGQDAWARMILGFGGVYVRVTYDGALTLERNTELAVALIREAIER
jgi:hypothetical protein